MIDSITKELCPSPAIDHFFTTLVRSNFDDAFCFEILNIYSYLIYEYIATLSFKVVAFLLILFWRSLPVGTELRSWNLKEVTPSLENMWKKLKPSRRRARETSERRVLEEGLSCPEDWQCKNERIFFPIYQSPHEFFLWKMIVSPLITDWSCKSF